MPSEVIQIVDRGRGPQLSTSRITVQDLVPYFQDGCPYEEILRWIPSLSREEIALVEEYYREHKQALDEEDREIRERTEEQIREQRLRFPEFEGTSEERIARLRHLLDQKLQGKNGAGTASLEITPQEVDSNRSAARAAPESVR